MPSSGVLQSLALPTGNRSAIRRSKLAAMSGKPGILTELDLRMSCKLEHYERNERKEKQQEGSQENFMFE